MMDRASKFVQINNETRTPDGWIMMVWMGVLRLFIVLEVLALEYPTTAKGKSSP